MKVRGIEMSWLPLHEAARILNQTPGSKTALQQAIMLPHGMIISPTDIAGELVLFVPDHAEELSLKDELVKLTQAYEGMSGNYIEDEIREEYPDLLIALENIKTLIENNDHKTD